MTAALVVENLSFAYSGKKALDDIGFTVNAGNCTILLGPNGAGKSTLFALITRLYDTHSGRIQLCGFNIKKQSSQALSKLGVVFQQSTLDMDLTVLQNLRYHAALHGMGGNLAAQRIQEELERFGMYERRFEAVRKLNGGHRRRVEIARALLHKPALLLLDEPTVGLDVPSRQVIVEHVHHLAQQQQIGVLWATHTFDEIYPDDRLVILHQGQIKAQGLLGDVTTQTATATIHAAFAALTQSGGRV
ncbi:MAG: ABC transporter ATP-binding protein [Methylococcales bacterium]